MLNRKKDGKKIEIKSVSKKGVTFVFDGIESTVSADMFNALFPEVDKEKLPASVLAKFEDVKIEHAEGRDAKLDIIFQVSADNPNEIQAYIFIEVAPFAPIDASLLWNISRLTAKGLNEKIKETHSFAETKLDANLHYIELKREYALENGDPATEITPAIATKLTIK